MDLEYLKHRLDEELRRAADADSEEARIAHKALADEYRRQIDEWGESEGSALRAV